MFEACWLSTALHPLEKLAKGFALWAEMSWVLYFVISWAIYILPVPGVLTPVCNLLSTYIPIIGGVSNRH